MGPAHREALAALQWGLDEPAGFTMLTGEAGTGKTTLIHALLASGNESVRIACVSNPRLSFDEMLALIVSQIGGEPVRGGRLGLLEAIGHVARVHRVAIVFDEAQQLSDYALEDLRLLSQAQGREAYKVQIILVGQTELVGRLSEHRLRQLSQRIGARASLPALNSSEVRGYLEFRLRDARGNPERILAADAIRLIAARSGGIPRRIDVLCRNAMMIAFARGTDRVQAEHVAEAAAEYDVVRSFRYRFKSWAAGAVVGIGLFAGAAMLLLNLHLSRPSTGAGETASSAVQVRMPVESAQADSTPTADQRGNYALSPNAAGNWSLIDTIRFDLPSIAALPDEVGPDSRRASAPADGVAEVTVREGDTLADIARRHLGSDTVAGVQLLVQANPQIEDADLIYPGQKLRLSSR